MGFSRLRRYEVQAGYAPVLSILAVFPLMAGVFLAWRNYHDDVRQIIYASGAYPLALLACIALSVLPSAVGCLFGWSSAGRPRNDRQRRSWLGFFVGGAVLTANVIVLVAFLMLRLKQAG
ncbi:MAG: hypothetical protein IID43_05940 [Planctomycetes bacterium]|nr:hypothetical protein [Planctomycetota bacterium]